MTLPNPQPEAETVPTLQTTPERTTAIYRIQNIKYAYPDSPYLCGALDEIAACIDTLAAFKAYVHKRLDDAGVPVDPESSHKAEGCRIGGRLDCVFQERDDARRERDEVKAEVLAARELGDHGMQIMYTQAIESQRLYEVLRSLAAWDAPVILNARAALASTTPSKKGEVRNAAE